MPDQPQVDADDTGEVLPVQSLGDAPKLQPYNRARQRDKVRAWLAGGLVALVGLASLASIGTAVFEPGSLDAVRAAMDSVFPALVGLAGSAVGFYFGGGED